MLDRSLFHYCLHRSYCSTLPSSQCQWVCGQKYPKTYSFFSIFLCKNSSLTKAFDSCSFLLKKYLIIVNLSHITLSLNHSIKYVCCWWTRKPEASYCIRWKLYCYSSTSHLTPRDFGSPSAFCFSFVFFVFVFWPFKTTTANLHELTHSNLSKNTNQVFYELSLLGVR